MAITKISRSLLNTGVSDSSDATAITIDSSERVGIGVTSPAAKLDIKSTGATSTALRVLKSDAGQNLHAMTEISGHGRFSVYDTNETEDIRLDSNGDSYFNGGDVGINLTNPDSILQIGNNDGSSYRFGYGGTSDIYFDSDAVRFRTDNGGANIAMLDTDGLKFGSDSAEANALDDYEEGTFEADIYSGSTNQVILNAVDAGKYVKIGRFVFITIQIYLNSVTSFTTSSTNNYINLPFVSASDTFNASGFRPMYYNGMGTINAGYLSTNTNKLYLCTSQNNILANLAGATTIGGSVRLYGDMTYMSAS